MKEEIPAVLEILVDDADGLNVPAGRNEGKHAPDDQPDLDSRPSGLVEMGDDPGIGQVVELHPDFRRMSGRSLFDLEADELDKLFPHLKGRNKELLENEMTLKLLSKKTNNPAASRPIRGSAVKRILSV